jgi:archaemetzincin
MLAMALASPTQAPRHTVCLQPLGSHDAGLVAPIARGIEQAYGFEVRFLKPRPLPKSAWYPPRQRYRAPLLLDELRAQVLPAQQACNAVLGLTAADVSISKGEHADWGVMGLSYLRERVGVVSSFRLRRNADRPLVVARAVKVSIHELGHVLGLPHASEGAGCIMNDARGAVHTIDLARGPVCAGERARAEALVGRSLPHRGSLDWQAILRAAD